MDSTDRPVTRGEVEEIIEAKIMTYLIELDKDYDITKACVKWLMEQHPSPCCDTGSCGECNPE